MSALDLIMRQPLIYRLWMAPFAKKNLLPLPPATTWGGFAAFWTSAAAPAQMLHISQIPTIWVST